MNKAVKTVIEGVTDESEWCEAGKKKKKQKQKKTPTPVENNTVNKSDRRENCERKYRDNRDRNKEEKENGDRGIFNEQSDNYRQRPRRNDNRPLRLSQCRGRPDRPGDGPEREYDIKKNDNRGRGFWRGRGRGRGFGQRRGRGVGACGSLSGISLACNSFTGTSVTGSGLSSLTGNSSSAGSQSVAGPAVVISASTVSHNAMLQQRQKPQRSKLLPPSKIPAVEMPGYVMPPLTVQFGDIEFCSACGAFSLGGNESVTSSFRRAESNRTSTIKDHVGATVSQVQVQNHNKTGETFITRGLEPNSPRSSLLYQQSPFTTPTKQNPIPAVEMPGYVMLPLTVQFGDIDFCSACGAFSLGGNESVTSSFRRAESNSLSTINEHVGATVDQVQEQNHTTGGNLIAMRFSSSVQSLNEDTNSEQESDSDVPESSYWKKLSRFVKPVYPGEPIPDNKKTPFRTEETNSLAKSESRHENEGKPNLVYVSENPVTTSGSDDAKSIRDTVVNGIVSSTTNNRKNFDQPQSADPCKTSGTPYHPVGSSQTTATSRSSPLPQSQTSNTIISSKELISTEHLTLMKNIVFLDLDNWSPFFQELLHSLSDHTFVWCFYSGKIQRNALQSNVFQRMVKRKRFYFEQCGDTKNATGVSIVVEVGKMHMELPKGIDFTIVSGEESFLEVERQMQDSERSVNIGFMIAGPCSTSDTLRFPKQSQQALQTPNRPVGSSQTATSSIAQSTTSNTNFSSKELISIKHLTLMKNIVFLDLDNWSSFFQKLPHSLPDHTFVLGFYGGKIQWNAPLQSNVFQEMVKRKLFHLNKQCGDTKNAADYVIVLEVVYMEVKLPKRIAFTIVSGDKSFYEVVRKMQDSERRVKVINPHTTADIVNEIATSVNDT